VIVPSLPVTPAPAVTGPLSGGQKCAHDPLQLDLVAVSGANEYTVKPLALVSTFAPPIVALFSAVLDEAAATLEAALGELLLPDELDEVPHAAAIRATPAKPAGAHHRIRIT
jgi:hypothetical protein